MRVLLLHNRYRAHGGEERAVSELEELLRRHGHVVERLERASDSAGRVRAARGLLAGGVQPGEVAEAVRRTGAQVVHAHNLHPLLGWRALAAARNAGARTVLHLHNFRLFCAIGIAFRDGGVCFDCQGRDTLPGVRHRCRGSLPEAVVYAAALSRQLPRLLEHADRLVTVSDATASRLVELGVPDERLSVLANFAPAARIATVSRAERGEFALAAGRIVEEKGFDTAIDACAAAGVPLAIAGAGPDIDRLRARVPPEASVRFTGRLSEADLAELRSRAALVLAPSRWEEPCPYAVLDAMAAGVPVLVSDLGGLPELAGAQSVLPAADDGGWSVAVAELWREPTLRAERGAAALDRVRRQFGEEQYLRRLLELYS